MSGKEKREQIPTEFHAEETQRALRRRDRVEGEKRDKTVSDFPQAAALWQVLKDLDFSADRVPSSGSQSSQTGLSAARCCRWSRR